MPLPFQDLSHPPWLSLRRPLGALLVQDLEPWGQPSTLREEVGALSD